MLRIRRLSAGATLALLLAGTGAAQEERPQPHDASGEATSGAPRSRADAKARADANSVLHGRSKSDKSLDKARRDKAEKDHTSHKRDDA